MIPEEQLKGQINTTDRQLLWDIRSELRRLNENIENLFKSKEHNTEERLCPTAEGTKFKCKYCGTGYNSRSDWMKCIKKCKKEGK